MDCQIYFEDYVPIYNLKNLKDLPLGCVRNPITKQVLEIHLIYDCYNETGYHCSTCCWGMDKEEKIYFCTVSECFYQTWFVKNKAFRDAIIMHEFGHVVNGDLDGECGKQLTAEESDKIRTTACEKGEVDARELNADYFSASQVGPKHCIRTLEKMIQEREIRNDEGAPYAINEFKMRIEHIKKMFNLQ